MNRLLATLLAVFVMTPGCTCAKSYVPVPPDLGRDLGPPDLGRDLGPRDSGPQDASTYDGPQDCSEYGGAMRCDERCSEPCRLPEFCRDELGLCLARPPGGNNPLCSRHLDGTPTYASWTVWCAADGPCAVREGPRTAGGTCISPEICLAARDAGLPAFRCTYVDGSELITGPPPATCPPNATEGAPFCGGACGTTECPQTTGFLLPAPFRTCVGTTDARGFGVCTWGTYKCGPSAPLLPADPLDECTDDLGEPCACIVLTDAPDGGASTFVIARAACEEYRRQYPGSIDCTDRLGVSLP